MLGHFPAGTRAQSEDESRDCGCGDEPERSFDQRQARRDIDRDRIRALRGLNGAITVLAAYEHRARAQRDDQETVMPEASRGERAATFKAFPHTSLERNVSVSQHCE